MQTRREHTAKSVQPEVSAGIFECRRQSTNVSYFGKERRASREQFGTQSDWWLKVGIVEEV